MNSSELKSEYNLCSNKKTGFPYYAKKYQRIFDIDKKTVPFIFNEAQTIVNEEWNKHEKVRLVIVKPRKYPGMSTYVLNRSQWRMKFERGYKARHYIHAAKLKVEFSERMRVIGDHLPDHMRSRDESYLTDSCRSPHTYSHMFFDTAGQGSEVPRGTDLRHLHLSEFDFYPNGQEFLKTALLALPDAIGTELIVESTPFVYKGALFNLYFAAKDKLNNFTQIFIPWFRLRSLRRPVTNHEEMLKEILEQKSQFWERELFLIKEYNLDLEQIAWRRWKIMELNITGDIEEAEQTFMTEFPEDDMSCFMSGKSGIFSKKTIERHLREIKREKILPRKVLGIEGRIYFNPIPGRKYIIAADVSEGPESNDQDAACVLDVMEGTQVAVLHGNYDIDVYTDHLYKLGTWYNNALLAVERNNHGMYVNGTLKKMGYPRLYYEGKGRGSEVAKWGFYTSPVVKPLMIDELKIALNKDLIIPYDEPFLRECLFCRNLEEHTGDILMATSIANFLRPKAAVSMKVI